MLLIGLTGSIATGKSTVATILSSPPYSLPLIDADILARSAVSPGTLAYQKIVTHFSPTTPDLLLPSSGGALNRAALGRRVFRSSTDRAVLNSIIHPAVRRAMLRSVLALHLRGHWACVLDIPLLYESALDPFVGVVLLVACSPETQFARLRARDQALSEEEARDRVASQMPVAEKVGRTENRGLARGAVLWNEGSKQDLESLVQETVDRLKRRRGWSGWWDLWLWGSPYVAAALAGVEVGRGYRERWRWQEREKRRKMLVQENEKEMGEKEKL